MKIKDFLSLASISVLGMHVFNKYTSDKANSLFVASNNNFTYTWDYGNISYSKQGIGKPLLLIHDLASGSSSYEWNLILSHISEKHTVYVLDLIGFGFSDKPNFTYTNYLFVKLITDFIQNIVKAPCDIVSSGSSSSVALMSAHSNSELVDKIIMINPASISEECTIPSVENQMRNKLFQVPIIGTFLANYYNQRKNFEDLFYHTYFYNSYNVKSEYIDAYYLSYHTGKECSKSVFSSIYNHYTNFDCSIALKTMEHPLYIIGGKYEKNISDTIHEYLEYCPNIDFTLMEEAKHLPQLEHPEELMEIVEKYL